MDGIFVTLICAFIVLVIWFIYLSRDGGDYNKGASTRLHRAWRRIVFGFGNMYTKKHAPFIDTQPPHPALDYDDVFEALKLVKAGDVGLHREEGAWSNLAIPGFMKHAWIHVNGPRKHGDIVDITNTKIIEAVSEGVLERNAAWPIMSEYTIILRPKNVSEEHIARSIEKAKRIVGFTYDVDFKFDIEDELKHMGEPLDRAIGPTGDFHQTEILAKNLVAEYDGGFSCTEVVSYSWWHRRKALGLFRKRTRGKDVILADNMINNGFEIVWVSRHVTPESAKRFGLGEEGVEMIKEFLSKKSKIGNH